MSSDNCIAILKTMDKFKQTSKGCFQNMFEERIPAYRVAHVQSVDSYSWYKENEPHNVGYWMYLSFGDETPVFYDEAEAFEYARKVADTVPILEYGILSVDASEYNYPGC